MIERKAMKLDLTLGNLFEEYLNGHAKQHCVAIKNIEGDLRRYILPDWKDRKLSTIANKASNKNNFETMAK